MPKFAANLTLLFTEYAFEDRFAAASKVGFKGVEFLFPYAFPADLLAEKLGENDLQMALFNMPPGDWEAGDRGMAIFPSRKAEFRENVDIALEYAKTLNCPILHCMTGVPKDNTDIETLSDCLIENLHYTADKCATQGITLAIEPLNNQDVPGYFLTTTDQTRNIIEQTGHPNLGLQLDFYHMQIMEGNLEIRLRALADITRHIQISSVPGRHEPDLGEINYPHLFDVIDDTGYKGWVGCEYNPANGTEAGLGWLHKWLKEHQ